MSEVEILEARFYELRSQLSTGLIAVDEFRREASKLWFEDVEGRTWMIGAQTGQWYVYEDDQWMLAEPPRAQAPSQTMACPRCGKDVDASATFCGHCGYRLGAPPVEPAASELTPSAVARTAEREAGTASPRATESGAPDIQIAELRKARRKLPRPLIAAALGAFLLGLVLLCLAGISALAVFRNGSNNLFAAQVVSPVPTSRSNGVATRVAAASATATSSATPAATIKAVTVVPTPIVVIITTATPTPTAQPTVPTATPSPTATPTHSPTPAPTSTPTPVPPTSTPRPPTNTPVPRPPTSTPTPVVVMTGHIVYSVFNTVYNAYDVFITAVDGSGRQTLAAKRRQPQFSADGSRLVMRGMESYKEKLFKRDTQDGGEQAIENTPLEASLPSWSPDGGSVVYASTELDDRQSRLFIVDARGAGESRPWLKYANIDLIGRYPTWLANGQIVYKGCDTWSGSGQCGIVRVNPDGGGPIMLTNQASDGAPSGTATTVVFMSNRDGNWEIYSVPLAGGPLRNLTNSPGDDGLPTFSPDGKFIAFVTNRSGQWEVWAMKADGSDQRPLFSLEGSYAAGGELDWMNERISWGP